MSERDEPCVEEDIVTRVSPRSVTETVSRLRELLSARGIKVFAVIDQSEEARRVGPRLRDTTLVIFGTPLQGTPVMVASPLAALDLPLKVVVWADSAETKVSYRAPRALVARYGLDSKLVQNLAGIDVVTDALVAE